MESLNKTRAFLTEFIIVILFFSIAAVITIGLYVEADERNDESLILSKAAIQAQSVAECTRAENSLYKETGIYTEYLDENMYSVNEDEAVYVQKVIVNTIDKKDDKYGKEYKYDIIIESVEDGKNIYTLTIRKYISKEVQ